MSRPTPISSDEDDSIEFSSRSKSGGRYALNSTKQGSSESETEEDKNPRRNRQHRTQHSENDNRGKYSSGSESNEVDNSTKTRLERKSSRTNYNSDHDSYKKQNVGAPEEFSPLELVSILEKSKKRKENIFELIDEYNVTPKYINTMLKDNSQTFHLGEGGEVRLKPGIKVCNDYNYDGCRIRQKCLDLHICMEYINDDCSEKSCVLGHKFDTNHNLKILQHYHLQNVAPKILKQMIQLNSTGAAPALNSSLKICKSYNKKLKCDQRSCHNLHICYSYVTNRTKCQNLNCKLNHEIFEDTCKKLLRKAQISTNESPCDVLDVVAKGLEVSEDSYSDRKHNKSSKGSGKKYASNKSNGFSSDDEKGFEKSHKSSKSNRPASSDNSSDDGTVSQRRGAKSTAQNNKPRSKSIWTTRHEEGNVKISEICYYSVEERCRVETEGCPRLHSELHFHWQISKQGNKWLNLPNRIVIELERAYCDPSNLDITLSKVDIPKHSALSELLGSSSWKLNVDTKQVISGKKTMCSRRLCTQKNITKSGVLQYIPSSNYVWYFLDENKKWIQYGKSSQKYFVSKANSYNIESEYKKYLITNTKNTMTFENHMFTYCINFDKMIQANMKTGVERYVRRRPELDHKFQSRK